jgi:hypothetical protein
MSTMETFAAMATGAGIPVDAATLPDQETVARGIEAVDAWFWSLPPEIREGLDEASRQYKVAYLLADPGVGVGSEIPALLSAFDEGSGLSLSEAVSASRTLLQQSADGVS